MHGPTGHPPKFFPPPNLPKPCSIVINCLMPKDLCDFINGKVEFDPVYRLILKHKPRFYAPTNVPKPCNM